MKESSPATHEATSEPLVTIREDVARFLLGEGPLDGSWFGEHVGGRAPYWWRDPLRLSMHPFFAQSATASLGVLLESAIAHALEKRPENISDFCDDLRAFMNRAERGSDK